MTAPTVLPDRAACSFTLRYSSSSIRTVVRTSASFFDGLHLGANQSPPNQGFGGELVVLRAAGALTSGPIWTARSPGSEGVEPPTF